MKPYALIADLHLHNWQSFSTTLPDGVNSRLQLLLNEIERAADAVRVHGGSHLVIAGDVFHVRGSVAPSVLNPVIHTLEKLSNMGIKISVIAGNHDLEGKNSEWLGSAVSALASIAGVYTYNVPVSGHGLTMIPWFESIDDLKDKLEHNGDRSEDLIIHAPIDGVIAGIPDHGLSPEYLASLGYKRVFAGHYHNHKQFPGSVYSIGAIGHHTWSDVDSKAGFLIVTEDEVIWHESKLPKFVDVASDHTDEELKVLVKGNYVRAKVTTSKLKDVEELRKHLLGFGALGVNIMYVKEPVRTRETVASVKAGASLAVSVEEYIKSRNFDFAEKVSRESQKVLMEAGAI